MRWRSIIPTEHEDQATVLKWTEAFSAVFPEACLLFAIPNGGLRPKRFAGFRKGKPIYYSPAANKLRAEGVKAGVPDLFLPVARHGYYGLFIEMKRQSGSATPDQEFWHLMLRNQNYAVCVCRGADVAINAISGYLSHRIHWIPEAEGENDRAQKASPQDNRVTAG